MLELMYITNDPKIAKIAENSGVNRVFVDMEYIGKEKRQHGMDTVKNHHSINDVRSVKNALCKSKLLVRVNPIFSESENEIESVIEAGTDIIMLPMWKTRKEVQSFVSLVGGRCRAMLLLETKEALDCLDDVIKIPGVDEIHIGLNDLHLSLEKRFLFKLLADGTVEKFSEKMKSGGIPFGFGGFGRIGEGLLPADLIVAEHYRLGSSLAILSRSFCDLRVINDYGEIERRFNSGIKELRGYEEKLQNCKTEFLKTATNSFVKILIK